MKIRLAYKPHPVQRESRLDGHLSRLRVTPKLQRSTRRWLGNGCFPPEASLLLDLAPHGGCLARRITAPAGGLLHHLFTLTPKGSGLFSVALFQTFTRFRALPGVLPCGVRTFLATEVARPSGQPDFIITDEYYTLLIVESH